jgi:hypothetical protein
VSRLLGKSNTLLDLPADECRGRCGVAGRLIMAELGGQILESEDIGMYAVEYAHHGWQVFPLTGKIPAIPKHRGGNGVLDATTDPTIIDRWWGTEYPGANIGLRLPTALFVLDIDPRHDGHLRLAELEATHGKLPVTRTVWSGRGDGGRHFYYRHPGGKLISRRLGHGLDIKTSSGYVVAPPSIHPDSGQPYRWEHRDIARPPHWLVELLREQVRVRPVQPVGVWSRFTGDSIADAYTASTTWNDVLPTGWTCVRGDGDSDGSGWRHPTATSPLSATITNGCLFVYSPNTPFEVTEAGSPVGYTKFRAYAVLNHNGDLSAAARHLREAS